MVIFICVFVFVFVNIGIFVLEFKVIDNFILNLLGLILLFIWLIFFMILVV